MKTKKILFLTTIILIIMSLLLIGGCTKDPNPSNGNANPLNVADSLINPNATKNTIALYNYLKKSYGTNIISGQYIYSYEDYRESRFLNDPNDLNSVSVFNTAELQAVHSVTDDYPAIVGLDVSLIPLGDSLTSMGMTDHSIDFAEEWFNESGIVTMCWHWFAPNRTGTKQTFYSKDTDFDLAAALADKSSDDYKAIISDIDKVSEGLKVLNEKDVPVLWRPLHEASGKWFWWGSSGCDAYLELYDLLYDRMVNYHGLNNLIWVANAQSADWYVGDDKCDILADDPYYTNGSKTAYNLDPINATRYSKCKATTKNKIIAIGENDYIPKIDKMFEQKVYWATFITWCREYTVVVKNDKTTNEYSEKYVKKEELKEIYTNERTITLKNIEQYAK